MKKMFLVVFCFLILGSLAYASAPVQTNFNVGCANFFVTRYSPGAGIAKKFITGVLDESGCGRNNEFLGGFQHGNPSSIPPNVTPLDDFSLPFYGLYGLPYSIQYMVRETGSCVFASYSGRGAANYLINSGSCTRLGPDHKPGAVQVQRDGKLLPTPSGTR